MKVIMALSLCFVALSGNARVSNAVPGEYLVKLHPGLTQSAIQGFDSVNQIQLATGEVIYKVTTTHADLVQASNPAIEVIEPNYLYTFGDVQDNGIVESSSDSVGLTTDDPMFGKLWGLSNTGSNTGAFFGGVKGMDVNAVEAWKIETGRSDVVIAVIDTGLDYTHPDLQGNIWNNPAEINGQVGVDDDGNGIIDDIHGANFITGSGDPADDHGHGTHVSGTIAAVHGNGIGVKGVMAHAQIMGLKFLNAQGSGTLEDAIKAVDYATAHKVDVMSNSWGGGGYSELLKQAIARASDAGIVFVAAAGNSTNNNDKNAEYPAGYQLPNMISVAAHQGGGSRASFSNYGVSTVHIAAPGTNILSTVAGGGYKAMSGTSMATPHVSGAVGLLLSREASLTPTEVRDRIVSTAKKVLGLGSTCQAKGRLDMARMLQNVQN